MACTFRALGFGPLHQSSQNDRIADRMDILLVTWRNCHAKLGKAVVSLAI
jgi:hypothetical protein